MVDLHSSPLGSSRRAFGSAAQDAVSEPRSAFDRRDAIVVYGSIEIAITVVAGFIALIAYPNASMHWHPDYIVIGLAMAVMSFALSTWSLARDHYQRCITQSGVAAVGTAFTASAHATSVLLAVLFAFKFSDSLPRSSLLYFVALITSLTVLGRVLFNRWSNNMIVAGRLVSTRAIVIGEAVQLQTARTDLGFFQRLRRDGVQVVATDAWSMTGDPDQRRSLVATICERSRLGEVDSVIVLPSALSIGFVEQLLQGIAETPLTVHVVPFVGYSNQPPLGTSIAGQASLLITNSPLFHASALLKRVFDVAAGLLLLVLLSPLLLGIAIAIKLDSRGPVLFRQARHGYGNRSFRIFKFRSMRLMEDGAVFRQATRNDPRITRVGQFIRRSNLDELPQLVNVILGDMSLVGPRPHPVALNDDFSTRIRMFNRRHNIRPGITGWAQVNGFRGQTDTDIKMTKRIEYDLWYIDNWSFLLDMRILIFTLVSPTAYKNAG